MIRLSVKKPFLTIVAIIIVLVVGYVALGKMKTDLLPDISLPYMIVITTEPGASPEKVENDVIKPLENALGTISGVENITSNAAENYGLVMMEFTDNTNMDSALVRVSSAINKVSFPEECGNPNIMEISMDMVATMYASIHYEGKDIIDLTEFAEEVAIPYIERQEGVANITEIGAVKQSVEVRLDKDKIDKINDSILENTDSKLADAEKKLEKGEKKLKKALKKLEDKKKELSKTRDDANKGVSSAMYNLDKANASLAAYEASLEGLKASKQALEAEKKAYKDNGIEKNYKALDGMFGKFKDNEQLGMAASMQGIDIPEGMEDAVNNPDKFKRFKEWLTQMGQGDAIKDITPESLKQISDIVNVRIPQIDTEIANLNTETKAAEAIVKALKDNMQGMDKNYEKALSGGLDAAAGFGSGDAQLEAAKSSVNDAKKEMKEAKKNLKKSKKAAKENANIDKLLTLETLSGLIYAQNFEMPAGYVDDKEDNQWLLKVGDNYESVDDISNMVLCKVDGPGTVRLKDVAVITVVDNADNSYSKYNKDDAILLAIYKSSTSNTSEVADNCRDAFSYLEDKYDGLSFSVFTDQSKYINMFLETVLTSIAIGAILAIFVLALFLKSVRPTIVVAFSIPFSVLFAIILMYFTDININAMSLAGLGLAIGMLVDNSIVVIENICRMRDKGISAPRASVQGAKQVAGPIIASTLTTICVFLPMVFTTGMVKDLVIPFAFTISYALTASLIVALTVVPSVSSFILKNSKPKKQTIYDKLKDIYGRMLGWCLRFKFVVLAVSIILLAFCSYMVFRMGIIMIPEVSDDTITITARMPEDIDNDTAVKLADEVLEKVMSVDGIKEVSAMDSTSTTNMFIGGIAQKDEDDVFKGFMFYAIPDDDMDKIDDMKRIISDIKDSVKDVGCEVNVGQEEASSSFMSSGISVEIYGEDPEVLKTISNDIMDIMGKVEGLTEISNGLEDSEKAIHLVIDKDKAAKKGLNVASIFSAVNGRLTTEKTASTLSLNGREIDVNIINETEKLIRSEILNVELEAATINDEGEEEVKKYKLSDFAKEELVDSADVIRRKNQKTYLNITSKTEEGYNATLLSRELAPLIDEYKAPEGYTVEIAGESVDVEDMIKQMLEAILLGLLLIYLIMVAQFQSLLSPFIVLFTIPLAFTGGLIGLLIAGEEISAMALMGFMVLMGTVVNNGIVFVDYINQLRLQGLDKKTAIIATGKTRMRPILMTALTTILAMSNLIFTRDISSAMSKGMSIVIAGGLLYSTFMTLFIVPVMYDILYRKQPKIIDVGDDLDDIPNDAEEYMENM